uniref:Epimerase domain-containing protein n=1 Tax=Globodera pallida TaxID=36090 RepID=A0A183BPV2_GLOPA
MEEWRKSSSMLKNDFEFAVEENEGQQNDYTLTAVLTGADGTIGSEILDYLLSLEFYVFVIGMSAPHLDSDQMHFIKCDLSDRNQVFEAVECVLLCASHIDLLTIIEPHLAVNVLANAQLFASFAHRLEDSRIRSPRAVFVSSCTAHAGDLSLLLQDEEKFWCHRINGYKAYADSKLLLSVYVKYLNRILKYRQSKIAVVSVHPGIVPGKLYRNVFAPFRLVLNVFLKPFLRSPLLAATRVLDVAFADDLLEGSYYENGLVTAIKRMDDAEFVWVSKVLEVNHHRLLPVEWIISISSIIYTAYCNSLPNAVAMSCCCCPLRLRSLRAMCLLLSFVALSTGQYYSYGANPYYNYFYNPYAYSSNSNSNSPYSQHNNGYYGYGGYGYGNNYYNGASNWYGGSSASNGVFRYCNPCYDVP